MKDKVMLAQELIDFIYESPTAFHAVETVKNILDRNGFSEIKETEKWNLKAEGKYYVIKNNSAIAAFVMGRESTVTNGFKIVGAHTDSPTFRIKPHAEMTSEGSYLKLNTEVYGGPILNTWMDRPLSIAGRVILKSNDSLKPNCRLLNIKKPILIIPNIAIHMNREANKGFEINAQKHTLPLVGMINDKLSKEDFLLRTIASELKIDISEILDFDLFLYEFEKGCIMGINDEFISSGRLDDLAMVHAGLEGLINSQPSSATNILVCFDNEEIGSTTKQGADSIFLSSILERIVEKDEIGKEAYFRALANSFIISSDLAHAVHPNWEEKADPTNRPVINKGPAIKISANFSYTTDAYSSAIYEGICKEESIPIQKFANKSDSRGGSTIGPISWSHVNIPSVDIGTPVLAMHSIRELGGVDDHYYITKSFKRFYSV